MSSQASAEIQSKDFHFLKSEFCARHGWTDADFAEASDGLKTFFEIVADSEEPLAITSKKTDELWHTFILFTKQYRDFCGERFGRFIDHQPNTFDTPVPPVALLNLYRALKVRFGAVQDFWLIDLPQHVQDSLRAESVPNVAELKWSGWTGLSKA